MLKEWLNDLFALESSKLEKVLSQNLKSITIPVSTLNGMLDTELSVEALSNSEDLPEFLLPLGKILEDQRKFFLQASKRLIRVIRLMPSVIAYERMGDLYKVETQYYYYINRLLFVQVMEEVSRRSKLRSETAQAQTEFDNAKRELNVTTTTIDE